MKQVIWFLIIFSLVAVLATPSLAYAECTTDSQCPPRPAPGLSKISPGPKCCHGECLTDLDQVCLNIAIGTTRYVNVGDNAFFTYIKIWYGFVVGSVGILATVMIMWGGFKWLTSRGNSSIIGQAKEIIFGAVTGLLLTFLSYTILNILNPSLLEIKGLDFSDVDVKANQDVKPRYVTEWNRADVAGRLKIWNDAAWEDQNKISPQQRAIWEKASDNGGKITDRQAEFFIILGGNSNPPASLITQTRTMLELIRRGGDITFTTTNPQQKAIFDNLIKPK